MKKFSSTLMRLGGNILFARVCATVGAQTLIALLVILLFHNLLFAIQLKKLSDGINTPDGDLAPTLSADGSVLIFQSNRPGGKGWYDLYESTKQGDKWSKPKNIQILNTKYFDGLPFLSPDGRTLFFSTNRHRKSVTDQDLDIWYSKRDTKGNWQKPQPIREINSSYYDAMPSISFDGKILYFSSNRPGGVGGRDIWVSYFQNGQWTRPTLMQHGVNTKDNEINPTLLPAGDEFYFASDREGGQGEFDLYRMKWDTTLESWGKPHNVGPAVNTDENEYFFALPSTGDFIYISRGESNEEDIYQINLPPELKPTPVLLIQGEVIGQQKSGKQIALPNAKVFFRTGKAKNKKEYEFISDLLGKFYTVMRAGLYYEVEAQAKGYEPLYTNLDLQNIKQTYTKSIRLILHPPGPPPEFAGVYFITGKTNITDESFIALRFYLSTLKKHEDKKIVLQGYADYRGKKVKNIALAKQRAEVVKQWLVKNGISPDRIQILPPKVKGTKKDKYKMRKLQLYRTVKLQLK
ncbi:MAG: hypothetical protein D6767_01695 [Candidatus Hydrogenedentota bacterium]|nr:MAG: hypothetical protein D6767_01695 [Candidatus Hydrogenedentota bacterium]